MCFIIPFEDRFGICQSILYIGGVVREGLVPATCTGNEKWTAEHSSICSVTLHAY